MFGGDELTVLLDDLAIGKHISEGEDPSAGVVVPFVDRARDAAAHPELMGAAQAGETGAHDDHTGKRGRLAGGPGRSRLGKGVTSSALAAVAPFRNVRRSRRTEPNRAAASSRGAPGAWASDDVAAALRSPERHGLWELDRTDPV